MYATVNPATGALVREFPSLTDEEARSALDAADRVYVSWSALPVWERADVIWRIGALHRERADELAALLTLEMGKPIAQAKAEVALAASIYDYYADKGPGLLADEVLEIAGAGSALVRTAPVGALLGIMPWNFPLYQMARFIAPNLLLGNTILLKHAQSCPQTSLAVESIIADAGMPAGGYANVFATHGQVAEMIASPLLQGVSITGSERAGRIIGGLAGSNLKKCVLELGGSDPLIVLPDADIEAAASAAATGRFWNAGQACTSSKRTIVTEPVWDEFVERFLAEASGWNAGDPSDPDTRLGPLATVASRGDVAAVVDDAVAKGATLLLGGSIPAGDGAYYPATVLADVTPDMRAYREEIFGPVAVLYRVDSVDAAVDLANDSPFGLGSAVFASTPESAGAIADRLQVGMVGLNMLVRSSPEMPFGGVKNSGIGRELGRFGLDEFSNKKLIRSA
jgi:succinate-semialdehyde dehydrogenase/glutarate-semialdehyde dehydrogenase